MGMPLSHMDWTVEMVNALPDDGNRYEVIDGELLVSPAPSLFHQSAVGKLYLLLAPYADAVGLDAVFAPAAVTFSARREVQPDLFVLPRNAGRPAKRFEDVGQLMLAVEVLSPHSARTDRHRKRARFRSPLLFPLGTRGVKAPGLLSARPRIHRSAISPCRA